MWILQKDDEKLPKWLTDNLSATCKCGGAMENFYSEPGGRLTSRRCSNPTCIYREAKRVEDMCEVLKVKGVGMATGLKILKERKLTSHFEAIPFIFKDKPTISLADLLRITFISGVNNEWEGVAASYESVEDMFENYKGRHVELLNKHKDEIMLGAKFVDILKPHKFEYKALVTGSVMLSGNIRGLVNRNSFIYGINESSKGMIQLTVAEHKKIGGVIALVQEADSPIRGKAEFAKDNLIPIMTPDEFTTFIIGKLKDKMQQVNGRGVSV